MTQTALTVHNSYRFVSFDCILYGFPDVHVMPDADAQGILIPAKEWCAAPNFQFSREETERLLRDGEAKVYDIAKLPPIEGGEKPR